MAGFQERLRLGLKRKGIPQTRLAELAGVDGGSLSKIINGQREGATLGFLTSLAVILDLRPGWLLFGEGPLPEGMPAPPEEGDRRLRKTKQAQFPKNDG